MPTPDPATEFDDDAASLQLEGEHQDFDALLRELARPAQVGTLITQELAERVDVLPFAEAALQAASAARSLSDEPQPGELLGGSYLIEKILGRGGMGVVLEAQNQRTGKRVAIKWMNASTKTGDLYASAIARFRREARVVAEIDHRNVVNVYDVGEREGTPFLVMELLRGETLRAKLARGPLSWEEARELMLGITRGVQAVHRAGVVHRDLKPDNIFLCSDGEGPAITKVLDFGVAAMRKGLDVGSASLTHTGAILGTPAYMPLEQLKGDEVDGRADVYALGAMLYEMVTGALPFNARTVADFAVLQATEHPIRPSRHRRNLRGPREQLLLRALARRPEDRYPHVSAFARALEAEEHGSRVWPSRPLLVAMFCALLAIAAVALDAPWRSESAPDRAPLPVRTAKLVTPIDSVPRLASNLASPVSIVLDPPAPSVDASPDARPLSARAPEGALRLPRVLPASVRPKRHGTAVLKRSDPSAPPKRAPLDGFTEIRLDDF